MLCLTNGVRRWMFRLHGTDFSFFVMGDPQRPAAEILARRGPYADMRR